MSIRANSADYRRSHAEAILSSDRNIAGRADFSSRFARVRADFTPDYQMMWESFAG
jgi:hypothetical protein